VLIWLKKYRSDSEIYINSDLLNLGERTVNENELLIKVLTRNKRPSLTSSPFNTNEKRTFY